MKNRRFWPVFALLLCVLITAAIAIPYTLAYIMAGSNTLHNSFRLDYIPPEPVEVQARILKTVRCIGMEEIGPGGFSFRIVNLDTNEMTSLTSFTDGWAATQFAFDPDDVGKTYRYQVYEITGERENMTYDESVHTFTITLGVDEHNCMTADLTVDGAAADEIVVGFENIYTPVQVPDTGDHAQPMLWLAALLVCGAGIMILNRRQLWIRRKSNS